MRTVHDIQQQQVLDNLAMFACNPDAFPFFSIATQGTSTVSDNGSLAVTTGWGLAPSASRLIFNAAGVNPTVSRAATEVWTLTPINDSVKLALMRCAFQRAIAGCVGRGASCDCPNCNAILGNFYPLPPQAPLPLAPAGAPISEVAYPPAIQSAVGTDPVVINVSSPESERTHGAEDGPLAITVRFSEPVYVTASENGSVPTLALNVPAPDPKVPVAAKYTSGSATDTLTFTYTPGAKDSVAVLDVASTSALQLNKATIKDAAGNDAKLALPDTLSLHKIKIEAKKGAMTRMFETMEALVSGAGAATAAKPQAGGPPAAAPGGGGSGAGSASGAGSSQPQGLPHVPGIITPYCLSPDNCWFCCGCKKDVPKHCDPLFVGHYGDTYVWVPPSGRNELSKLTLLIQDIAFYQPPTPPTPPTIGITFGPPGGGGAGSAGPGQQNAPAGPTPGTTTMMTETSTTKPNPIGGGTFTTTNGTSTTAIATTAAGTTVAGTAPATSPPFSDQMRQAALNATVQIGTNPDAILFAHKIFALDTILSRHNMSEQQLVDYWSRGVAGPGMNPEDAANISQLLGLLCRSRDWTARPTPPSRQDVEMLLFGTILPDSENKPQLVCKRLADLAALWSRGQFDRDGVTDPNPALRLAILDFYRMDTNCNPVARLGADVLDRIAYSLLRRMPEIPLNAHTVADPLTAYSQAAGAPPAPAIALNWAAVRQRLSELQVPVTSPPPTPSPIPYGGGLLGAAVLLQAANPQPAPTH